jgi:uncharacterized protein (UPF0335 family)
MAKTAFGKDQLRSIIERIERLEEEKASLANDIKEVYAEAKGNGFDTKAMRKAVRIRKMDAHEREEQDAILELYLSALGMLADTPLGAAAIKSAKADAKKTRGVVSQAAAD